MSVEDKVMEILADQALLDREEVTIDATLESLGLDSLALVEIVFSVEEEFGISVPFNANDPSASNFDISSVKSIAQGIKTLQKQQHA